MTSQPWNYCQSTADLEFMSCYAAEVFLEIARFWASFPPSATRPRRRN
jgi:trehalose/maltose hydrolase-like predicted phosphorylase